jgi:hypothetical protein
MPDHLKSVMLPDPSLTDTPMATYLVTEDSLDDAVGHIADYFGADTTRWAVRLRFPTEVCYLKRRDLTRVLTTLTKGFGQGGYATLPGRLASGQAKQYEFRCPVDGCPDSPVFLFTFDQPPVCTVHDVALELVK